MRQSEEKFDFDWQDFAFSSKKGINNLSAIFVTASRKISQRRIIQLVKQNISSSNIIFGLAKEDYIDGFNEQPQFETLKKEDLEKIAKKLNSSSIKNKIFTLSYFQRDQKYILESLKFKKVIFINGSWQKTFHTREEFYILHKNKINYELVSPFVDEEEAVEYSEIYSSASLINAIEKGRKRQRSKDNSHLDHDDAQSNRTLDFGLLSITNSKLILDEFSIFQLLEEIKKLSFATDWQTSAVLAKKQGKRYKIIEYAYNSVIPYETYAMHFGSSKEKNFSPPNDLNHFDTNHAEVELLIKAQKAGLNFKGLTLFINLLPCPTCCKMLCKTDISEIVYNLDHSDGYAFRMFEKTGKKVRKLANKQISKCYNRIIQ